MTPETRGTALDALRASLDTILSELNGVGWYEKGDWRGRLHRKSAVVHIRTLRRAIRDLRNDRRRPER